MRGTCHGARMAILHKATLTPGKLEIVAGLLPDRPWGVTATPEDLERVGSFRFDDPAGKVGVETLLVQVADGPLLAVPMSYREAPLEGAQDWLVTTMDHSVLGQRWAYDGCADPVWVATTLAATLGGGQEAEQVVARDGKEVPYDNGTTARGTGTVDHGGIPVPTAPADLGVARDGRRTSVRVGEVHLVVAHLPLEDPGPPAGAALLEVAWPGQDDPVPVAWALA